MPPPATQAPLTTIPGQTPSVAQPGYGYGYGFPAGAVPMPFPGGCILFMINS
jgi:CubicO group peptidase (beta-lactamase class C family)